VILETLCNSYFSKNRAWKNFVLSIPKGKKYFSFTFYRKEKGRCKNYNTLFLEK